MKKKKIRASAWLFDTPVGPKRLSGNIIRGAMYKAHQHGLRKQAPLIVEVLIEAPSVH